MYILIVKLTKNQRIKYFTPSDPDRKTNQSMEELVNEFLEQDSVNAIGVTMHQQAIILLYEVIYINADKTNKNSKKPKYKSRKIREDLLEYQTRKTSSDCQSYS